MRWSKFKHRISPYKIGIWFGVFLLSTPAFGEFYKYVGPDGRIRFTDDYSKIPIDQRQSLKEYKDSAGVPATEAPLPAPKEKQEDVSPTGTQKELAETKSRLESQRQELFLEHEAIMKEKEALQSETRTERKEIEAFNKRAVEFNDKIKDYEKRLDIHNKEVAAYNERVKSYNESLKKEREKEKEKEKK